MPDNPALGGSGDELEPATSDLTSGVDWRLMTGSGDGPVDVWSGSIVAEITRLAPLRWLIRARGLVAHRRFTAGELGTSRE